MMNVRTDGCEDRVCNNYENNAGYSSSDKRKFENDNVHVEDTVRTPNKTLG